MKALLLALLTQAGATEWSSDLNASLKRARDGEVVLCVAVVDDTAASHDTLRSFDTDAVRPPASKFIKVKVPDMVAESGSGLWILSHVDLRLTARVRIFRDFMRNAFEPLVPLIEGDRPMSGTS